MEILLNCWTINYVVAVGCLAGRMVVFSFISSLHSLCLQCVQYHTRFVRINVYTKCISLFYSSTLVVAAAAASKSAWDSLVEFLPSFDAIFEISNTPYAVSQSVTKSDDDDNYNDDVWLIWPKKRPRKRHQIIINLLEIIFFSVVVLVLGFFCSPQFIVCRVVIHIYLSKWTHVQFQRLWRLFVVGWLVGRPFHLDESGSSEKHAKDWSLNRVKQLHKCFCFFKTNNRSSCIDNNTRHKHDLNIALSPRRKFTPHSQLTWNAWRSFCGHNNNISLT